MAQGTDDSILVVIWIISLDPGIFKGFFFVIAVGQYWRFLSLGGTISSLCALILFMTCNSFLQCPQI